MDTRRPARLLAGFATSLLIHALLAALLFSLATSSSDQSAPESFSSSTIVTVTRESPAKPQPAAAPQAQLPAPHAPVLPNRVIAAQPRSAAPHPPVRHELSKFAPTAPPNPTPQPESSSAPNPLPTQAVIAVTPAPLEPAAPTSAPAQIVAVTLKVPTSAPARAPAPTAAPKTPATPKPQPSALLATAAPLVSLVTPHPMASAGSPQQIKVPNPSPLATGRSAQPSPGPKPVGSPGPRGAAPVKSQAVPRPVQAMPATPKPAPAGGTAKAHASLNQRLNSLIPTGSPAPAPVRGEPNHYSFLNGLKPTPQPEPTPPPDVLAKTQYLYEENVSSQRWKQSFLGTAPEEGYVKMYVTSVKRLGLVSWCSGWVVRAPLAGSDKWIVEPDEHLICSGRLTPFTLPSGEPPKGY